MPSMTNYLEDKLLDHVHGRATYTAPTTLYLALFTSATDDNGGGTEVNGGSYARQSIDMGAGNDGTSTNTVEVEFPTATADWGVVTHAAIMDAQTGGNMLFQGALNSSREIKENDVFKFPVGNITNELD